MTERTFEINIEDHMGYLRVYMGRGEPNGELTRFLYGTLAQWMQNLQSSESWPWLQLVVMGTPWNCMRSLNRENRPRKQKLHGS